MFSMGVSSSGDPDRGPCHRIDLGTDENVSAAAKNEGKLAIHGWIG